MHRRFTDLPEIDDLEPTIKRYVREAIEIERSEKKVEKKKTSEFNVPEELEQFFFENTDFEKAFKNLTAGRQRGYLLHFNKPKQSKTMINAPIQKVCYSWTKPEHIDLI